MKKAAILARASTNQQDTDSQIQSLMSCAENFGFEIPNVYIFSENITGMDKFDKEERESIQNLKQAIETNKDIECVFMWELTRLSRNPFYLIDQLRWFNENKVPIYFNDIEKWTLDKQSKIEIHDTTTYIFGAATYGQSEWEKIRKRTMRGRNEKAKRGLFVGHISDGYKVSLVGKEKHIVIDEVRKKVVQAIFNWYTEDHFSTNRIARELNEKNEFTFNAYEADLNATNPMFNQFYRVRGTNAKREKIKQKWKASTIGQLLKNRWYIGEREYNNEIYPVPAIITKEQFEIAQERLKTNNKVLPKRRVSTYLLKGKLFCGKCGALMNGHKVRINSSYYCSSLETGIKCGSEGINKQNIESIVWDMIFNNIFTHYNEIDFHDLFKIPNENIEELKNSIKSNEESISRKKSFISSSTNQLSQLYADKALAISEIEKNAIAKTISSIVNETNNVEAIINSIEKENRAINLRIENNNNIDNIVFTLDGYNTLEDKVSVIEKIIEKVTLYNLQNYDKLIIIDYFSLKRSAAIYNSKRLKGKYINLDPLLSENHISFDSERGVFLNNHKCIITYRNKPDIMLFNTEKDRLLIDIINASNDYSNILKSAVFESEKLKESLSFFTAYYSRLEDEPSDEEYKKWKEDYKRWSKIRGEKRKIKRNSIKPEKIENSILYDKLNSQRKIQYNLKYKFKNNKSLSFEDCAQKLEDIETKLKEINLEMKGLKRT